VGVGSDTYMFGLARHDVVNNYDNFQVDLPALVAAGYVRAGRPSAALRNTNLVLSLETVKTHSGTGTSSRWVRWADIKY